MSFPVPILSTTPKPAPLLPPDSYVRRTRVIDHERAGFAVQNPSGGLNCRNWTAELVGDDIKLYPDDAPGSAVTLITVADVSHLSLSFDSNMRPAIAYQAGERSYLWWYDTTIPAAVTLALDLDARSPTITLDDKRRGADAYRDILLFYVRGHQLFYRQQRDRFTVERLLWSFPGAQISIRRAGMNKQMRMQCEVVGSDAWYSKLINFALSWTAAIYDVSSTSLPAAMPAGLTPLTLLLAAVMTRSTVVPPAGWSLVTSQSCTDGTTTQILSVFRKDSVTPANSGTVQNWGQTSALRIGVAYLSVLRNDIGTPNVKQFASVAINSTSTMDIDAPQLTATDYQELIVMAATSIVSTASVAEPVPPRFSSLRSGAQGQTRIGVSVRARFARNKNTGTWTFPGTVATNGLAAITLRIGYP